MKQRYVYHGIFWAYCAVMVWLLFGRTRFVAVDGYWNTLSEHVSLTPFRTIRLFENVLAGDYSASLRQGAIVNLLGNIVMFLPLGFLPPLLWKGFRKLWKCLLWGGLIIVGVELVQLFALVGNCDVDDLLLNLVGIAIGYGLYHLLTVITKESRENDGN